MYCVWVVRELNQILYKYILNKPDISEWVLQGRKLAIVWHESVKVIGHISIDEDSEEGREDTREFGCALNRVYQRQGIMSEAIIAVLDYLFNHGISYV